MSLSADFHSHRSLSISHSGKWDQRIDEVVQDHQTGQTDFEYRGITRNHWKPSNARFCCANENCNKKFGLTDRKHHCRRCGDIFCDPCTQYQRRLNNLAHPDPEGKLYKVCKDCYDQGPQTLGRIQSITDEFKHYKKRNHQIRDKLNSSGYSFNIQAECNRLISGFKDNLGKRLSGLKSAITTPDWQRAPLFPKENLAISCRSCKSEFGSLLNKKHHCTVCGVAICNKCSSKDLIVYISDEETQNHDKSNNNVEPQLSIIRIVGCPEKEPEKCEYLRVCVGCKEEMQSLQVAKYHEEQKIDEIGPIWQKYIDVSLKLKKTQDKIEFHLPRYQVLIESMEIKSGAPRSNPKNQSNIQTLAKAVSDLSDHFTEFVLALNKLKKIKPSTACQEVILKNMIRGYCDYYMDNKFTFQDLQRRLQEVTPLEVLNHIQAIVDQNALNSAYMVIKQLALETLLLCEKHKLTMDVPQIIGTAEEVFRAELKSCIEKSSDNWIEHEKDINEMLKTQLRSHRLIKLSKRQTEIQGVQHVRGHMLKRVEKVLESVKLQMAAKCSHSQFQLSKDSLETLHNRILEVIVIEA